MQQNGEYLTGLEIWWQWEIHDQSGQTFLTDRQSLTLVDQQLPWKTASSGQLTFYWYQGGQSYGEKLLSIAEGSVSRIAEATGFNQDQPVRVIIYPSPEDMQSQMAYLSDWTGGVALPDYGLILIAISPYDGEDWANAVIPHELAHLMIESNFSDCDSQRLPHWLNEGFATYSEGPVSLKYQVLVNEALQNDALPPLKQLRYSFPLKEKDAQLAYAQSVNIVDYLVQTYGMEKMTALIDSIRQGKTVDQAMRLLYGFNTDQLDQTWRAGMGYGSAPEPDFTTETPIPTRTPFPTMDLHPSVWTPPTRTVEPTHTPTRGFSTKTPLPASITTAAGSIPATGEQTKVIPTSSRNIPAQSPQDSSQTLILIGAGIAGAILLAIGIGFYLQKRV